MKQIRINKLKLLIGKNLFVHGKIMAGYLLLLLQKNQLYIKKNMRNLELAKY